MFQRIGNLASPLLPAGISPNVAYSSQEMSRICASIAKYSYLWVTTIIHASTTEWEDEVWRCWSLYLPHINIVWPCGGQHHVMFSQILRAKADDWLWLSSSSWHGWFSADLNERARQLRQLGIKCLIPHGPWWPSPQNFNDTPCCLRHAACAYMFMSYVKNGSNLICTWYQHWMMSWLVMSHF